VCVWLTPRHLVLAGQWNAAAARQTWTPLPPVSAGLLPWIPRPSTDSAERLPGSYHIAWRSAFGGISATRLPPPPKLRSGTSRVLGRHGAPRKHQAGLWAGIMLGACAGADSILPQRVVVALRDRSARRPVFSTGHSRASSEPSG
jgi:hypothetical protein